MPRSVTGDAPVSVQTTPVASPFSMVTQAQLASATHAINDYSKSGKEAGTAVMVTMTVGGAVAFAIAQGRGTTAKWNVVGDTAATPITSVTPA